MNMSFDKSCIQSMEQIKDDFRNTYDLALRLFSEYIGSNPAFRYNTTYLTDQLDSFADQLRKITQDFSDYCRLYDDIVEKYIPDGIKNGNNWSIVIGELFVLSNTLPEKATTINDILNPASPDFSNAFDKGIADVLKSFSFSLYEYSKKSKQVVVLISSNSIISQCDYLLDWM